MARNMDVNDGIINFFEKTFHSVGHTMGKQKSKKNKPNNSKHIQQRKKQSKQDNKERQRNGLFFNILSAFIKYIYINSIYLFKFF